jgi:hypothetical protein
MIGVAFRDSRLVMIVRCQICRRDIEGDDGLAIEMWSAGFLPLPHSNAVFVHRECLDSKSLEYTAELTRARSW